jgi:FixJ family two-component response regulator
MSGRASAPLIARAEEMGINEVLRKPLHAREIAEALARALAGACSAEVLP